MKKLLVAIDESEPSIRAARTAVGSRRGGALARWALGSVADRLVHTSETPVLVVH